MRHLDTISIRMFLSVIEAGSIAKAAQRECTVPSAVSKRIAELEAAFRVPLLERGARGVKPTPAGEAFASHARMVVQALERMDAEMSEYGDGVRGHVRVVATLTALTAELPNDIDAFMRQHRNIKIELEEQNTPTVFRAVADGLADIGVAPDIAEHEGLQLFAYRSFSLSVVMPADHPLANESTLTYAQILDYEQVEVSRTSGLSVFLDEAARQTRKLKRTRIHVSSYETVCRMVSLGMGVGVVPLLFQPTHGRAFNLKFTPLTDHWANPMVCLAVRDVETLPPAPRALLNHLQQQASRHTLESRLFDNLRAQRNFKR